MFVFECGYVGFISYVVKMGWMCFIEIYVLVDFGMLLGLVGEVDVMCDEIVVWLDVWGSMFWLIIDFIVDLVWM